MIKKTKKLSFANSKEKIQITHNYNTIYVEDKFLNREIEKIKKEKMKNNIPINYIKVDEKILTAVYKIPNEEKRKNINQIFNKESKNHISHKKYIFNTINNDKLYNNSKNSYFHFKPFSSKEEGYKYYKQNLNTVKPIESESNNYIYLKKSKSPKLQYSIMSTRMNSLDEKEYIRNKYRSPSNLLKNKRLYSPFYQRYLNNSGIKALNNNRRIRHRIINLNRENGSINNNFNKKFVNKGYDYNYNNNRTINSNNNRTINYNNYLEDNQRIYLNNNISKRVYSINNSHLSFNQSPKANQSKNIFFKKSINIDNYHNYSYSKNLIHGKMLKSLERNKSKNDIYNIRPKLSKRIFDKKINTFNEDIKIEDIHIIENRAFHSRKLSPKKDERNSSYFERREMKSPLKNEKINHIRRSPLHNYEFHKYTITENNKKPNNLQTPHMKGKLISFQINNNNKDCKMCIINERKKRQFGSNLNNKENNILFPNKFKKRQLYNHIFRNSN